MDRLSSYKPVGGIESVALYPADAVARAIFSCEGCEVELSGDAISVPLIDDGSQYEECSEGNNGIQRVAHSLRLTADRECACEWFSPDFVERVAIDGVVAVISLCDGRRLLAGYSVHFGCEQPLRLEKLISNSGESLRDIPTATLHLVSYDTEFSPEILNNSVNL